MFNKVLFRSQQLRSINMNQANMLQTFRAECNGKQLTCLSQKEEIYIIYISVGPQTLESGLQWVSLGLWFDDSV